MNKLILNDKHVFLLLVWFVFVTALSASAQEKTSSVRDARAQVGDSFSARQSQDFVTLNFTNIELAALVKVLSEMTHRSFLVDERIMGKITVMTPTKITPDEAYQVFLSALELKGFTAIEDGKFVRIIPAAAARQSGLKVVTDGEMRGEGFVTKYMHLKFMNSQEAARTLMSFITKDGSVIAYAITNSLILTDSVHNIRQLESLIAVLDVPSQEGKGKINTYHLHNADAEEISKDLTSLIARLPATTGAQAQQSAGTASILEGTVSVAADKATNTLVIIGSSGDYDTIRDLIQKLDIRRRQVYVEAAIIEISLTKQHELGFEFQTYNWNGAIGGTNFGNIANVIKNGPSALAQVNGLNVGLVKGTFTFKGVEYLNVGALMHALQSDGEVNILSMPSIMVTNNQKAETMAGENIPVITGQTQTAFTGITQVQRMDVGVILKCTPQITSDDSVRLDLYQEISAVTTIAGVDANVSGPSTSKRTVTTSVVVRDGETMVIGGLIRDNANSSKSKVPLLGDIPLLGRLFQYNTTKVDKTNLMIFITPYIIKNKEDANSITKRTTDKVEMFRQEHRLPKKTSAAVLERNKAETMSSEGRQRHAGSAGSLDKAPDSQTAPVQQPQEK